MPKMCIRCLYDESIPRISFDARGVCNYCHIHDAMDKAYPTGKEGRLILGRLAREIRALRTRHKSDYDVIVGVSGGCDSSMLLWGTCKLGLKPLAIHFDNGWNTETAEHNMKVITERLDVPMVRYRVDTDEFSAINRAFLRSGTRDFEAPTDIGLTTALYRCAEMYSCKYIFNGHSFRTEGIAPLGWSYMDGRYIADVCRRHGGPQRFDTYPNLWLKDFLRRSLQGIKRVRPLYWMDYDKDKAKMQLAQKFGWRWYDGHHKESVITEFFMHTIAYERWDMDMRRLGWSALIRSGQMSRQEGLERIQEPFTMDDEILAQISDRLGITITELSGLLAGPRRTEKDYRTYKRAFERLRPLFWVLMKMDRVPFSFYTKYCLPEGAL